MDAKPQSFSGVGPAGGPRKTGENMTKVNPIQVQKYLKGIGYPASREQIIRKAEESGADATIMQALQKLPETEFRSPNDISSALGKVA
jgi:Protein of unknown function (DUF2795)